MTGLTRKIDHRAELRGIRGVTGVAQSLEVTYQRNGVSGIGFHHVRFLYTPVYNGLRNHETVELHGVLADVEEGVKFAGVVDPRDLNSHWRGDHFQPFLEECVAMWSATLDLVINEEAQR